MKRRQFRTELATIALTISIARPWFVRSATTTTLKFLPYAALEWLDALASALVTRNPIQMVFHTLFALGEYGDPRQLMLA